jgi:uncharacterized phiE125 gp8 family phage protein
MLYHKKPDLIAARNYELIIAAESTPITLDEIKDHIRETFGIDDYDNQLMSLINVVAEYGEKLTGRDFINKTYKGYLDCFPNCAWQSIEIRKSKLQSISSIKYLVDNVETTLDSAKYYFTQNNNFSSIYLVDGESWPDNEDKRKQAVIIEFVAGYGDDSCDIPTSLKQAMLSHLTTLFKNAGDCTNTEGVKAQFASLYSAFILPSKRFKYVLATLIERLKCSLHIQ